MAADVAKVGKCLLGNCQVVLAKCLADGECVENLICLQLCNGRADETACQVISPAPLKSPADRTAHLPSVLQLQETLMRAWVPEIVNS